MFINQSNDQVYTELLISNNGMKALERTFWLCVVDLESSSSSSSLSVSKQVSTFDVTQDSPSRLIICLRTTEQTLLALQRLMNNTKQKHPIILHNHGGLFRTLLL